MRLALLALLAAACGGSHPSRGTDVIESHAPPAKPRATPAPSVAFADGKFALNMLPAVARAGEAVIVPISGGDAGRGYPNLKLEIHDRSDKVVQTIDVMTSNEFETFVVDGKPGPALEKRIAAANAELVRQHNVHDLVAMHALEMQKPLDGGEPHLAIGDGMDVDWNRTHLHVLHHNTDREVTTYDGTPWLVKDHEPCPKCPPCENPAHLDGVWHANEINVLVIQVGYRGTDTCWEPADQMHVVVW
ncbi:MAG: hypothetical protein JO257_25225 [Deltaproteobacteria bacterium]|nr:hypothetical protein [Deltaproteobacteria bacterium]